MDSHLEDGRLLLDRTAEEIRELVLRLNRIEGQVRGIRTMIENGRHCRDELQQVNAASAALREIAVMVASQHVEAGIDHALRNDKKETVLADLLDILQVAIRRP